MLKSFLFLLILFASCSLWAQDKTTVEPAFEHLSRFNNVRDFTLSTNQEEAYFTIQSPFEEISAIAVIKKIKGQWSEPELVPFTGKNRDIEPFLSPDNLRLYFSSNRPINEDLTLTENYDIWYVERKDLKSPWSNPINLGAPVNTSNNEFYPSVAKNGNMYFTSDAATELSKDEIYFSKWNGKNYETPIALDKNINSEGYEFNAYISPQEDILIYTAYARTDGFGSGDLYISYKGKEGLWSPATNLGNEINSKQMDYCPFIHSKTNTLYFTSKRNSINFKPSNSLSEFEQVINQYENGLSRIYKMSFSNKK